MASHPDPNFDEHMWVMNIRETLKEELEIYFAIPVCIFNVPKTLMFSDPRSYTPQEIAIGPYHHWRPELYEMEKHKLAAAKRVERKLQGDHTFEYVVDQLKEIDIQIRACYHKYLHFNNETLAWMMAIDASFLLEFLQVYAVKERKFSSNSSKSMSSLVDYTGTTSTHNAILRDIVMLENQIPLLVLRKMVEVEYLSLDSADDMLQSMLMALSEDLSPFKKMTNKPILRVSECNHLLDLLYDTIVPKVEQVQFEITEIDEQSGAMQENEIKPVREAYAKRFFSFLWKQLSKIDKGPIHLIKKLFTSRAFNVFFKLPWTILSKLPGFSILAQPIQHLIFPKDRKDKKTDEESNDKPPSVEEIAIPSVSELSESNVHFVAVVGNVSTVSFDTKTATLFLPKISLDVNSEVILRNLVAYEASVASGPLVFTRYTELMNGIIDTAEDVKILREKGIILNRLKSDAEVANLWNGMSKSIRTTKVPHLDKTIEDVNKHYRNRWKIKFRNYMRQYVFGSWKVLTLLATILFLGLTVWESFCSSYNCHKFNIRSNSTV